MKCSSNAPTRRPSTRSTDTRKGSEMRALRRNVSHASPTRSNRGEDRSADAYIRAKHCWRFWDNWRMYFLFEPLACSFLVPAVRAHAQVLRLSKHLRRRTWALFGGSLREPWSLDIF